MSPISEVRDIRVQPSPVSTPQALAWDGNDLWVSSRDDQTICRMNSQSWKVEECLEPPGTAWAGTRAGDGLLFTIGEPPQDDRYVYRYTPENGFEKRYPCPELTGSYLSYDGANLYLSQWYKHRILRLNDNGEIAAEFLIGEEIAGHTFARGKIYVLRGTEQGGESWKIAEINLSDTAPSSHDVASIPFAGRSLAFDGTRFWSNHRAENKIVSFIV